MWRFVIVRPFSLCASLLWHFQGIFTYILSKSILMRKCLDIFHNNNMLNADAKNRVPDKESYMIDPFEAGTIRNKRK